MKKTFQLRFLVATALVASAATTVNARSWRINNDATKKAHFTSINAAMSSADVAAGDTLYLDPGCQLTSAQTITKAVTIIGGGFAGNTAIILPRISATLAVNAAETKLEGLIIDNTLTLSAARVLVERCQTANIRVSAQYCTIRQCYVNGNIAGDTSTGTTPTTSTTHAYCTIENNIIVQSSATRTIMGLYAPLIRNNYVHQAYNGSTNYQNFFRVNYATIENNIIRNDSKAGQVGWVFGYEGNTKMTNNVILFAEGWPDVYLDNLYGYTTEADVFALTGSGCEKYQLKDDSPAKGYATDGGDCGPYGGAYPFVATGQPYGIPYIVSSSVSSHPVDGKVTVRQTVGIQEQ